MLAIFFYSLHGMLSLSIVTTAYMYCC